MSLKEQCPHCQESLIGRPIPEHLREEYGVTHFNKAIGVTVLGYDRINYYSFPFCEETWVPDDEEWKEVNQVLMDLPNIIRKEGLGK